MTDFRISLVQMEVTDDKERNVDRAIELVERASEHDPDLIALPENFYFFGTNDQLRAEAEGYDGPTLARLRRVVERVETHLVTGTMKVQNPDGPGLLNSSCVVDPAGEIVDVYNKIHVFQADVGGDSYRSIDQPGDDIVVTDIGGVPVGLTVCFDVRFPELYRILALEGAKVVLVPAMFTLHTGKDHWEALLRARAIENGTFVAAPAVIGQRPPNENWTYGRSLVVDPWGVVVAKASDRETTVTVDLDLSLADEAREKVPVFSQRRPEVYDWPD